MKRSSPWRLEEMLLTLVVILLICLHGDSVTAPGYELKCLSDYLFTINCSLVITQPESTYSWLKFTKPYPPMQFPCPLEGVDGHYHCLATTCPKDDDRDTCIPFSDVNVFQISLCHEEPECFKILEDKYSPVKNIKPNPPCCLIVGHDSGHHHFTWKSTYENFSFFSGLIDSLDYELHYYKKHDQNHEKEHFITTNNLNYSVSDDAFAHGTDYVARVRSTPSGDHYIGQWSEWSSEVYWRTETAVGYSQVDSFISEMVQAVLIFSFVVLPFILFLCYAQVKRLRQRTFIPTPAPYFQSLYTECQGDFKSWADTQKNTTDTLKAEETSPIDSLTKRVVVQEDDCPQVCHQSLQGSTYRNINDSSLLGIPYAVSTMAPLATSEESFKPGSPAEEDSGCWLSSDMSLERHPPWYCNEYCTLNAFQQPTHVPENTHESGSVTDMGAINDVQVNVRL